MQDTIYVRLNDKVGVILRFSYYQQTPQKDQNCNKTWGIVNLSPSTTVWFIVFNSFWTILELYDTDE